MASGKTNYVFGPVPSSRLGRSLGIDLVPFKTCTYDCIYCQLGRTTCKTAERKEWVPLGEVLDELRARLPAESGGSSAAAAFDYITLSGSGEPTLFSRAGELIDRAKAMTDVPVAVLTNGSLLWQEDVRGQLSGADVVIPSLDAGDEATFRAVNRPHESISFERMLSGLVELRRLFRGRYWLEVFLLAGYTAMDAEVAKIAECVELIRPDRVHLNTVRRPPAEGYAVGVSHDRMRELAAMFRPPAEVVSQQHGAIESADFLVKREEILDILRRRPCAIGDVARGLGIPRVEAVKYLDDLKAQGLLVQSVLGGETYYRAVERRRSAPRRGGRAGKSTYGRQEDR
jgi:wyosine [tRNA(Phe)-imidazoG37] synthetase (radical SAM superfamily)